MTKSTPNKQRKSASFVEEDDSAEEEVEVAEVTKSQVPIGKVSEDTFSLYVRGPKWLKDRKNAESKLKELNERIIRVVHPRQKSADFAYVNFIDAAERDKAYKELLLVTEVNVQYPRKDNAEEVEKRKAKTLAKREAKQQLAALKKNIAKIETREKKSDRPTKLSNQIVIFNVPKEATQIELNQQFANVVATKLNVTKNPKQKSTRAVITLATPKEALNASQQKIELHGVQLKIQLYKNATDVQKLKKEKSKKKKLAKAAAAAAKKENVEDASEGPTPAKRPLVSSPETSKSDTTKKNKNKKTKQNEAAGAPPKNPIGAKKDQPSANKKSKKTASAKKAVNTKG